MPAPGLDRLFLDFQQALAGRYSLERELGRGGMGVVYLAREVRLDRLVAIKLLPPELAAHAVFRERFLREARTAARLSQPNIIPIFAVDEIGGFVFYAMAYANGETLAHRVAAHGPLPPAQAARMLREVAWALAYAHDKGVVHRDIKPENILLEAGTGRALVTDFGIARVTAAAGLTAAGEIVGTVEFMSPEQAAGQAVDGRSDLYALGVVAHYALSGKLPFHGDDPVAVLAQHLTQAAPPLAAVARGVPSKLARAVDRCLAKDREQRFPTAEALADALGESLEVRRELPAPLRHFFRTTRHLFSIAFGPAVVGGIIITALTVANVMRGATFVSVLPNLLLTVLALGIGPAGILLQFRKVLGAGYMIEDIAAAAGRAEQDFREEVEFAAGFRTGQADRLLRHAAWGALSLAGVGTVAVLVVPPVLALVHALAVFTGVALLAAIACVLVVVGRTGDRTALRLWAQFWRSGLARRLARIAGWRLGVAGDAAVNRPTELAVGRAVEALFRGLPDAAQRALAELPQVVRRLEAHARRTRERIEELDRLLAEAGEGPARAHVADRRDALVADLRAARAGAERRLGETVAALEIIRLDLLRLRAGAGSIESLTADLAAAREISEQAGRLLAGQREVEQELNRA